LSTFLSMVGKMNIPGRVVFNEKQTSYRVLKKQDSP